MRLRFRFVCALLFLAGSMPARAADPQWVQANSKHFTLYTDTNEAKGRRLLQDVETRVSSLTSVLGDIPQRQFPIEVFLFDRKEDFLEAAPRPTGPDAPREFDKSAYLWRGPDRIFVAARDKSPEDIADDVGHALGHLLFERCVLWRPFWLAEGAAEYFRDVGRKPNTKRISGKDGYPVSDLLEIIPSKEYDDDAPATAFRIQSYRLLRVVLEKHPEEFRSFLEALGRQDGDDATLNVDIETLQSEFDAYEETLIEPGVESFDITTSAIDRDAMAIHRGDLLLAAKKTSEAGGWYNGDSAKAREARAILSRFSRGGGESLRLLSRAFDDLPDAGLVAFHLGSIETKNPDAIEQQARALERAAELLPRLGRVHGQLARVYTLLGRGKEALEQTDRAVELEPEFADDFYVIRADALLSLHEFGEANDAARMAAALPHWDPSVDYDSRTSELFRRVEQTRREVEGREVDKLRAEVEALVAEREPPPPPPPPPPPEHFGSVEYNLQSTRQLSIVSAPLPEYSQALLQNGTAGNITVRITIGADGKVTGASIMDSQLQAMNDATLDAVKEWTFRPVGGRASVSARVVFRFSIVQ